MKKYHEFVNENINIDDPYNEEEWDEIKKYNNLYVIQVLGQDVNFLCQKKFKAMTGRFKWKDYYYEMAYKKGNEINFNSKCTVREAYPAIKPDKVLKGEELVGYIQNWNNTRFDTLQNLCNIMGIPIEDVTIME